MYSYHFIQPFLLRILVSFIFVFVSLVDLFSQCDNQIQFPSQTINVNSGFFILVSNIWAQEYCLSTNYINGNTYSFNSSINSDYLTIRKASDNSVIMHGTSPLNMIYQSEYGNIEIHVNTNSNCGTQQDIRALTVNSFCYNTILYPTEYLFMSCGENLIADDIFAGNYFNTSGYTIGKEVVFESSNPNDYITLRKSNGELIAHDETPLTITYQESYGIISVHINKNEDCEKRDVARTITINKACVCNNNYQDSNDTISISCGNNIINETQSSGYYNLTTGYIDNKTYVFNSSIRTDQITLRSSIDNSLILEGISPLNLTYYNFMGDIEMHINPNSYCGTDNLSRITSVFVDCTCDALSFSGSLDYVSCADTTLIQAFAGESKNSTGYEVGQQYTFSSSIPTDFITLRNTSNNTFLASGPSPFTYVLNENIAQIEIHLFSDSICGEDFNVLRDLEVYAECSCYNPNKWPYNVKILSCDTNIISTEQYAGEYNESTGYIHGRNVTYTSSVPTDYIILKKSIGKSIISEGSTPLSIIYDSLMGDIEMHLNTDNMCGIQYTNRTTAIILECIDQDSDGIEDFFDNCLEVANPLQSDFDQDGIGDVCDQDEISTINVGIGTEEPSEKLHIKDGSIYIDKPFEGVIFKTLSGSCIKLSVSASGDFTATPIDCPRSN